MQLVNNFSIPGGSSGKTNLRRFFPRKTVRIDVEFSKCVGGLGATWTTQTQSFFSVYKKPPGEDLNVPWVLGVIPTTATALNQIFSLLNYLRGIGSSLLYVPKGEEEKNVLIGFDRRRNLMLFVEHEFKNGVEEIHLHARPAYRLKDDELTILLFDE